MYIVQHGNIARFQFLQCTLYAAVPMAYIRHPAPLMYKYTGSPQEITRSRFSFVRYVSKLFSVSQ